MVCKKKTKNLNKTENEDDSSDLIPFIKDYLNKLVKELGKSKWK